MPLQSEYGERLDRRINQAKKVPAQVKVSLKGRTHQPCRKGRNHNRTAFDGQRYVVLTNRNLVGDSIERDDAANPVAASDKGQVDIKRAPREATREGPTANPEPEAATSEGRLGKTNNAHPRIVECERTAGRFEPEVGHDRAAMELQNLICGRVWRADQYGSESEQHDAPYHGGLFGIGRSGSRTRLVGRVIELETLNASSMNVKTCRSRRVVAVRREARLTRRPRV